MTAQGFDFPAAIKWLADMEGPCPQCSGAGNVPERAYPPGVAMVTCSSCGGTGRIVPFVSLHVKCRGCEGCVLGEERSQRPWWTGNSCEGRGWVPEPDPEKAVHRVAKRTQELDSGMDTVAWWFSPDAQSWYWNNPQGQNIRVRDYEEAVICAAMALVKEKIHAS